MGDRLRSRGGVWVRLPGVFLAAALASGTDAGGTAGTVRIAMLTHL